MSIEKVSRRKLFQLNKTIEINVYSFMINFQFLNYDLGNSEYPMLYNTSILYLVSKY